MSNSKRTSMRSVVRTSERSNIDDGVRLVLRGGVVKRIGEDETALGVGVVHLRDGHRVSTASPPVLGQARRRTSIVTPFEATTMSPGLVAFPLGMFSVRGMQRTMLMGILSLAMAQVEARVVAAPPMSARISFMAAPGLSDCSAKILGQSGTFEGQHGISGFTHDSARVEGDTLSDKCERGCRRIGGLRIHPIWRGARHHSPSSLFAAPW